MGSQAGAIWPLIEISRIFNGLCENRRGNVGIIRSPVRASILPDRAPTPGPNGGVADSLDEAKAAFRAAGERQRPLVWR
jgi:hypothetical protein